MRPSALLLFVLLAIAAVDAALYDNLQRRQTDWSNRSTGLRQTVAALGLADLALTTEARYTRHPVSSDSLAPFMDHPGALEHFPSGTFFAPVEPR